MAGFEHPVPVAPGHRLPLTRQRQQVVDECLTPVNRLVYPGQMVAVALLSCEFDVSVRHRERVPEVVADDTRALIQAVPLPSPFQPCTSLVARVQESFPETTSVSKHDYAPPAKSDARAVGQVLGDIFETELTDRHQQALRAAMYGGHFKSPRGSTATETADTLSLTRSTFSSHLRNAQQTLFERLFDRIPSSDRRPAQYAYGDGRRGRIVRRGDLGNTFAGGRPSISRYCGPSTVAGRTHTLSQHRQ